MTWAGQIAVGALVAVVSAIMGVSQATAQFPAESRDGSGLYATAGVGGPARAAHW